GVDSTDAVEDIANSVDAASDFDASDIEIDLEAQRVGTVGPVKRGSARDPNRRASNLLNAQASDVRAAGARALGNLKDYTSISPLMVALGDRTASVRRAAADSLGKIGGFESLGNLRRAMAREHDAKTQRAMDKAIGAIEDRVFAGAGAGEPVTLICHS